MWGEALELKWHPSLPVGLLSLQVAAAPEGICPSWNLCQLLHWAELDDPWVIQGAHLGKPTQMEIACLGFILDSFYSVSASLDLICPTLSKCLWGDRWWFYRNGCARMDCFSWRVDSGSKATWETMELGRIQPFQVYRWYLLVHGLPATQKLYFQCTEIRIWGHFFW